MKQHLLWVLCLAGAVALGVLTSWPRSCRTATGKPSFFPAPLVAISGH